MAKFTLKKALSLVLSMMLVLSAISGAMLTVAAEDVVAEDPEWAGAEDQGINSTYITNTTFGVPNGDFSKGLKYWGVGRVWGESPQPQYPSEVVTIVTEENGNKYAQFKSDVLVEHGLSSNMILIDEDYINVGEYASVFFRTKGVVDKGYLHVRLEQQYADNGGVSNTTTFSWNTVTVGTDEDGWTYHITGCTPQHNVKPVAARNEGTEPGYADSGYYAFRIEAKYETTEANDCEFSVDDFQIVKFNPDDGCYYSLEDGEMAIKCEGDDHLNPTSESAITRTILATGIGFHSKQMGFQLVGGTAADGLVMPGWQSGVSKLVILDEPKNLDFSDGLKYWYYGEYKERNDIKASEMFDWADGAISLKDTATEGFEVYASIDSYRFKIPGLQKDDNVVLITKYKSDTEEETFIRDGNTPVEVALLQYNPDGTEGTWDWNWGLKDSEDWMLGISDQTIADSADSYFAIRVKDWRLHNNKAADGSIDGFIIAKRLDDGTIIDYMTGEKYYYTGNEYPRPHGGTEEDGVVNDDYPEETTVGLVNGDFSQGLKYWGTNYNHEGGATQISAPKEAVTVIEENGNKYIQFNDDVIKGRGISSNLILVSDDYVTVGDQVSVIYKIKGVDGDNVQIRFTQEFADDGAQSTSPVNSWQSVKLGVKDGWEYWQSACVTNDIVWLGNKPVAARNEGTKPGYADSDYYAFRLEIQYNSEEANTSGVAVDDFQMVKYGEDGNFYSLEDGEMVLKLEGEKRLDVDDQGNIKRTFVKTGESFYGYSLDFQPTGGTEENGIYIDNYGNDFASITTESMPQNLDFSQGLKYWVGKEKSGWTSDVASIVDGRLYVVNNGSWAGLCSASFVLDGIKAGDIIYVNAQVQSNCRFNIDLLARYTFEGQGKETCFVSAPGWGDDADVVLDAMSEGVAIPEYDEGTPITYFLRLQHGTEEAILDQYAYVDNIFFTRKDRGGVDKKVNIDGSLMEGDVYGDANADGDVNLLDLVRMKKYASAPTVNTIFLASVDLDNTDAIEADDLTAVMSYLVGKSAQVAPIE